LTSHDTLSDAPGGEAGPVTAAVLGLVRSRVRLRFALTFDQFARVLLARAHDAGCASDPAPWLRLLSLDDLYLAQACALHDERAWTECSALHFGFMREFAGRFLRGADAVEVTDRVIADLWEKRKLAGYQGRSSLRTWLGTVVANAAIQAGKAIKRREAATEREAAAAARVPAASPDDREAARVLAEVAAGAIRLLPADEKLLLLLHYEQDLSLEQIAPLLATSKATLSRRLKRLREEIRTSIERAARERYRATAAEVRAQVDLSRIELDLSALLRDIGVVKGNGGTGV
jgi:RNA polymerase sigma-70 factor (ECF subfamily)